MQKYGMPILMILTIFILCGVWFFLSCCITFYFKKHINRNSFLNNAVVMGMLLETFLSTIYILVSSRSGKSMSGIAVGLYRGIYIASLISPFISIFGAHIGIKKNIPPWKKLF